MKETVLTVHEVANLTPEEAARKRAYLETRIWYEQYIESPFVKDPRPAYYLRNELRAFWNGEIKEFQGYSDPLGQAKDWIVNHIKDVLEDMWNDILYPAIKSLTDGIMSLVQDVYDYLSDVWSWVSTIYSYIFTIYDYMTETIFSYLDSIWSTLSGIGDTIYQNAAKAVNQVYNWVKDAATDIINDARKVAKMYYDFYSNLLEDVYNHLSGALSDFKSAAGQAWDSITEAVTGSFEKVTKAMAGLPHSIAAGFQSAISYVYDVLKSFYHKVLVPAGQALKDGLTWIGHHLLKGFYDVADSIENIFKSFSPILPENAPNLALSVIKVSGIAAAGLLAMTGVWDLMEPFKDVIPGEIKAMIYDATQFKPIITALTGAGIAVAIAQPMKYYYNAIVRPYMPTWGDIMELKSRGMLDDKTFHKFMYYYGYDDRFKPYFDELANTPMSYFMLNMIVGTGFFDADFFKEEIKRMGYSQQAQKVLYTAFQRSLLEPTKGMFSSQVISRYVIGITDLDGLKHEAAALSYTKGQIIQIVQGARLKDDYTFVNDAIKAVTHAFEAGYITLQEFGAELAKLGIRTDKVVQYMEIEKLKGHKQVKETQKEAVRAYGQGIVMSRFKAGMCDANEFEQELKLLGYQEPWIQRLKVVALLERDYEMAKEVLSTVKSAWYHGKIGDETFIMLLRQYGFLDEQITLELSLLKLKKGVLGAPKEGA